MLGLLRNPWFWLGIGAGILAVGPKILRQYGVEIGPQGETPLIILGLPAFMGLFVGVWYFGGALLYPAVIVGLVANGILYAGVGRGLRELRSRLRSRGGSDRS